MRIAFDFTDLSAFLAVADAGSFHAAARVVGMSQPTLTRRIQKLERALGASLFERTTRRLRLTLAGKSFRARAGAMLDGADEALLAVREAEGAGNESAARAVVTIATIPTAMTRVLPRAFELFRRDAERARVRVIDTDANRVAEQVADGEAEFGVSFLPTEEPGLVFQPRLNDRFVLAMRRDDPLCERQAVAWSDVDPARFIVPLKGTGNRLLMDEALASRRLTLEAAYEAGRSTTHLGLVEGGVGVAAVPASAMPRQSDGSLVARPLVEPVVARALGTLTAAGRRLSPAASRLFEAVDAALREP